MFTTITFHVELFMLNFSSRTFQVELFKQNFSSRTLVLVYDFIICCISAYSIICTDIVIYAHNIYFLCIVCVIIMKHTNFIYPPQCLSLTTSSIYKSHPLLMNVLLSYGHFGPSCVFVTIHPDDTDMVTLDAYPDSSSV